MAKKKNWLNWVIILAVIVVAVVLLTRPSPAPQTEEDVAICIGEKSTLYVQLGCSHCEDQEEMFGEYYKHLNVANNRRNAIALGVLGPLYSH